ncbi:MAG: hypothetical protein KF691_07630 [Phycisphaeraceae bacterium]|nr:hypothetical protein [Phycisphaeraceae bacterium]
MGRTLLVRVFLAFCFGIGHLGWLSLPAVAENGVPTPYAGGTADPLDDLWSWLHQLCSVVHCDESRPPADGSISEADYAALQFVLSYEAYGVRSGVNKYDVLNAQLVTVHCLKLLDQEATKLDPDIEEALTDALLSLQVDLAS